MNEETLKALQDAGYTAEEISDLSDAEAEGILSKPEEGDGDGKPEGEGEGTDLTPEQLAKIAADKAKEGETEEDKATREAKEKEEAGKTPEQIEADKKAADEAAAAEAAKAEVLEDDDLLDVTVKVSRSELPPMEKILETAPPAVKTKLAELETALTTLEEKYDEGDLKLNEYNRERDKINRQIIRAEDQAQEAALEELTWQREQAVFYRARPDYIKAKDATGKFTEPDDIQDRKDAMFSALGSTVAKLNADAKYQHLPGVALLVEADKRVRRMFGIKAEDKKVAARKEGSDKPPAPTPAIKTLADVPAAGSNSTGDAFAEVDKLQGEAYENFLAKQTPEWRAEYERRAG